MLTSGPKEEEDTNLGPGASGEEVGNLVVFKHPGAAIKKTQNTNKRACAYLL